MVSGRRLAAEEYNGNPDEGVHMVPSTSPLEGHHIWLQEYATEWQSEAQNAVVTLRNAGSGRRLFADNEGELSIGFGASSPGASSGVDSVDELWEEQLRYKYANVVASGSSY